MALLRASVKKWNTADRSGVLQLVAQPCSLAFIASPAMAAQGPREAAFLRVSPRVPPRRADQNERVRETHFCAT